MEIVIDDTNAIIPKKATPLSAGYDLFSADSGIILPLERKMINTGIRLKIPPGYYGRIAPRSGLAVKSGIHTMAGVIDSDYTGVIKCILYNSDQNNTYEYNIGDRIAQIIFEKYYDFDFITSDHLSTTNFSHDGFGSTGK